MGVSVPININPGIGGASIPEDTSSQRFSQSFLQAFLGTKDQELRKQLFELQKKKMDMELTDKKADAERSKAEGAAVLELLPSLIGMGGASQLLQAPQGSMAGPMAPDTDQGPPMPSGGSQSPSQAFSGVVGNLPVESVAGFVQKFAPMMQIAQKRQDQKAALDEADRLADKIMTPDERSQMALARALAESGAPDELWQAQLPKAKIELAKAVEELKGIRNKRDADRAATAKLMQLGLLPLQQGGAGEEYVVEGATKILTDHLGDVRKEALAANRERAKELRAAAIQGLEGAALEIAAMNPDWSPAKIKSALRSSAEFAGLPEGTIAKAALEAPKKARDLVAPSNAQQGSVQMVYGPARPSLLVVNELDKKGVALNYKAALAQLEESEVAGVGGAIGAAVRGAGVGARQGTSAGLQGALLGAGIGAGAGLLGAKIGRKVGRELMSDDEQRFFTAAQQVATAVFRPETGAAASAGEVRSAIERYIPLSSDKPATRELKRVLRAELEKTLGAISGLPPANQKEILGQLAAAHGERLEKAFAKPTFGAKAIGGLIGFDLNRDWSKPQR